MNEEVTYSIEIAPLTKDQWDRLVFWAHIRYGQKTARGMGAARDFSMGIQQLQRSAGRSEADIASLQQASMKMTEQPKIGVKHDNDHSGHCEPGAAT